MPRKKWGFPVTWHDRSTSFVEQMVIALWLYKGFQDLNMDIFFCSSDNPCNCKLDVPVLQVGKARVPCYIIITDGFTAAGRTRLLASLHQVDADVHTQYTVLNRTSSWGALFDVNLGSLTSGKDGTERAGLNLPYTRGFAIPCEGLLQNISSLLSLHNA